MSLKLLVVTGGRNYHLTDGNYRLLATLNPMMLYAGDATGADKDAIEWAKRTHRIWERFIANWTELDLAAGPIRNGIMLKAALQEAKPYLPLLLAFPGNKGTRNCINQAEKLGIPHIPLGWNPHA